MHADTWIDEAIAQGRLREHAPHCARNEGLSSHHQQRRLAVHARRRVDGRILGGRPLARLRTGRRRRSESRRDFTERLLPRRPTPTITISGFMFYPSAIKAWRLKGEERYRQAAIEAAGLAREPVQSKGRLHSRLGLFRQAGLERLGPRRHADEPAPAGVGRRQQGADARPDGGGSTPRSPRRLSIIFAPDGSVYHVYKFDPATGEAAGGDTYQGSRPKAPGRAGRPGQSRRLRSSRR